MFTRKISNGSIHNLPRDLRVALSANIKALSTWEDISELARNEWICWIITVKQKKTRLNHVKRTVEELAGGKRRPCCWMGCIHREDKKISPSVQGILNKHKKKI